MRIGVAEIITWKVAEIIMWKRGYTRQKGSLRTVAKSITKSKFRNNCEDDDGRKYYAVFEDSGRNYHVKTRLHQANESLRTVAEIITWKRGYIRQVSLRMVAENMKWNRSSNRLLTLVQSLRTVAKKLRANGFKRLVQSMRNEDEDGTNKIKWKLRFVLLKGSKVFHTLYFLIELQISFQVERRHSPPMTTPRCSSNGSGGQFAKQRTVSLTHFVLE